MAAAGRVGLRWRVVFPDLEESLTHLRRRRAEAEAQLAHPAKTLG
jgi:hypothetical protein